MISLIHPSRGRPQKSFETISKWVHNLSSGPSSVEVIISCDEDDPFISKYYSGYPIENTLMVNKNKSAIEAINRAARISQGEIIIVVSDDTECPTRWDKLILSSVGVKKDWILKTQDGIQPWIITMPIMDRTYYNRFGYIYHPDYLHMFCDLEITCVADITGRKITSNLLFPHKHYSVTKERPDAVNRKADATWAQGEKLFLERYKRNFDLPPGKPIEDNGMINWLKSKRMPV